MDDPSRVNEVQIGVEMFYQRQCKLKCAQRWRGKIQRHKNVLDLQGSPLLLRWLRSVLRFVTWMCLLVDFRSHGEDWLHGRIATFRTPSRREPNRSYASTI